MNAFKNHVEHQKIIDIMKRFGSIHIEDLLSKSVKKLGLNKLRWVPIDFSISHLTLPEMLLMEYIIIASCIEERITRDALLDTTAFYRILAARNILTLLNHAYDFHDTVKEFYSLRFEDVLSVMVEDNNLMGSINVKGLMQDLSLSPSDNIKDVTDSLLKQISPIASLFERKNVICKTLTEGTDTEQAIINAYELYHLLLPYCFAFECPDLFSKDFLGKKYKTIKFDTDYDNQFVCNIREWQERGDKYED